MDATPYRKPSPYIRLADLRREPVTAVIKDVHRVELFNRFKRQTERKLVLCLDGGRQFVLEGESLETIIAALGKETDFWSGHRVRISSESRGRVTVRRLEVTSRRKVEATADAPESEAPP